MYCHQYMHLNDLLLVNAPDIMLKNRIKMCLLHCFEHLLIHLGVIRMYIVAIR